MNIFQNIARIIMNTRPNSTGMVFDFSMLSVEDVVILMFMLLTNDSKKDMKDILNDMEATRRSRRAAREAAEKRRAQMLADRYEQRKKRRMLALLVSGSILVFIIIGTVVLKYIFIAPPIIPTEPPVPPVAAPSGPVDGTLMSWVDGTLMSWVDGSTLVFYKGVWIYRSEVTNYQFSLCVEAGNCLLPAVDAPSPDDNDSGNSNSPGEIIGPIDAKQEYFNSPAQIIGPIDAKQEYCNWAGGGRLPTEDEASEFEGSVLSHPVTGMPLSMSNITPATDGVSLTGILIGLLLPGTENGIRCVVDAPAPMAPACATSAFYLNGSPTETDHTVTEAGRFCQKGVGYVTLDINLSDGGILQSVNGDCQVVGDNRILCSNQSGLSGDGEALILVNGLLPAVQREGLASAGQMQCLPGYEANPDLPSQCGFGELLPAVQNDSDSATVQLQDSNNQFAGQVSLVVFQPISTLSLNLDVHCPQPLSFSERLGRCVFAISAEDLARADRNTDVLPAWNPITGYPPPNADGICPEGSSLLNGLYCIPNEPAPGEEDCLFFRHSSGYGSNYILTNGNNCGLPPDWDPIVGFSLPNADGTCPEGTILSAGHCISHTAYWTPSAGLAANADGSCPEEFTNVDGYCYRLNIAVGWDPFAGYPLARPDGTCPEGSTNFYGFCIPDEPAASEEEAGGFGWNPITGYPPRNADGTCPEGTALFLDLYCLPNAAARDEGPSFGISWDPLGGFPLPDGYGGCPEGSALINGHCLPSEPPPSGSEGLTGSGSWNPITGYPSPGENGICPPRSTLFNGHCIPSDPSPSADSRCAPAYWFSETLGVCLPDVVLGCPVGTYFDKEEGMCIASGEATSFTLPGFHFDEASQCSQSDLPSGRYPGCPPGQAYDPSTDSCDFKNIYVENGKVLSTVEFNFSAPSCEANNNNGGDGGDGGDSGGVDCSQYTTNSTCTAAGCSYDFVAKACK